VPITTQPNPSSKFCRICHHRGTMPTSNINSPCLRHLEGIRPTSHHSHSAKCSGSTSVTLSSPRRPRLGQNRRHRSRSGAAHNHFTLRPFLKIWVQVAVVAAGQNITLCSQPPCPIETLLVAPNSPSARSHGITSEEHDQSQVVLTLDHVSAEQLFDFFESAPRLHNTKLHYAIPISGGQDG
jgi:hypothetical protein